ncbi:transposable element Tc3 transposase [Trichonephila clavipes]|nr:transposable element Tc3 transposase [Trichonephila clavipes]
MRIPTKKVNNTAIPTLSEMRSIMKTEVSYENDQNISADTHHARLWRHIKVLFKVWRFRRFQVRKLVFFLLFFQKNYPLCLVENRLAFDQVSEFERGRVAAYRDCGLAFRKIVSGVGRNQTTVMRICDRWMQEGTTDRRGRSHPLQCTTSREDRQIVHMAVTDCSVTSRTIAQHSESVTHHSVSARAIRHRLQQSGLSARRPLLGLPLMQNQRRLRRQWCYERTMWVAEWNEVVFTDESRICQQQHNGRIRAWRHRGERMLNSCVMHRHTGPAPGIMVWSGIGYHTRTPLVRIAGNFNSQCYISEVLEPFALPYLQSLATATFQQDNARPHVARIVQRFFVNHQIELLPWPARSPDLSPIENMGSMVAQRLTQITPPAATQDKLWQRVEPAWSTVPQGQIQSLFNQYRGVWQR